MREADADVTPLVLPELGPDLGEDVGLLANAAYEAGKVALGFFGANPKTWAKAGDSPVTEADIAVDNLLKHRLMTSRPGYGWLSEETADTPDRMATSRLFVVDPIDGTRAFINGDPRWAVSVAIVEGTRPIAAALYQPATDDLLVAARGRGAWRRHARLQASGRTQMTGANLSAPRKFTTLEHAIDGLGITLAVPVPSLALRIAHVATGFTDVAFAFPRSHDWDLAAADLIVEEAGGRLADIEGETLVYNRVVPRHPALIAAGPGIFDAFRSLYGTVLAKHHEKRSGA